MAIAPGYCTRAGLKKVTVIFYTMDSIAARFSGPTYRAEIKRKNRFFYCTGKLFSKKFVY
jgi:hypothetical protein